uniref:Uncharacterized protein n=1 Tax=Pavo cristatus TaxID=9049 RepID=A0A8C9FF55_PAVCR
TAYLHLHTLTLHELCSAKPHSLRLFPCTSCNHGRLGSAQCGISARRAPSSPASRSPYSVQKKEETPATRLRAQLAGAPNPQGDGVLPAGTLQPSHYPSL